MGRTKLQCLGLLLMLGVSAAALSDDKADLLAQIRASAGQYSEFKTLLNSPDQSIRVAAFDGMVSSGDSSLRDIAIDEALSNDDATMRALALREAIFGLSGLNFSMTLPDAPSEETKKQVKKWGAAYKLTFRTKDKASSSFSGRATDATSGDYMHGNVSGLELVFNSRYCSGKATLMEGTVLQGTISCPKYITEPTVIFAKIR